MSGERVTICVLLYGDYVEYARRTLSSIAEHCDPALYRLRVGLNACCPETLAYVHGVPQLEHAIVSETNLNKSPMMRRLLSGIETEYAWWFDDDVSVVDPAALPLRLRIGDFCTPGVAMWGHAFYLDDLAHYSHGADVADWVRRQSWFRGHPAPCGKYRIDPGFAEREPGRWYFLTGGNWFIRSSALPVLHEAVQTLVKGLDDVIISEALRQRGYELSNVGPLGVEFSLAPRRGTGEDAETMRAQFA